MHRFHPIGTQNSGTKARRLTRSNLESRYIFRGDLHPHLKAAHGFAGASKSWAALVCTVPSARFVHRRDCHPLIPDDSGRDLKMRGGEANNRLLMAVFLPPPLLDSFMMWGLMLMIPTDFTNFLGDNQVSSQGSH